MLSVYNHFVDSFQNVKTEFVNTVVTNDELKKPLQTYIDAQTSFAKKMGQETFNFFTTVGMAAMNMDAKRVFTTTK